jgi:hypothetical protein
MALIVILCVGYLFNENSSLCVFGKGGLGSCKTKGLKDTVTLTPEEQAILKSLQDKASKLGNKSGDDEIPVNTKISSKSHDQYQKVMRGLWGQ